MQRQREIAPGRAQDRLWSAISHSPGGGQAGHQPEVSEMCKKRFLGVVNTSLLTPGK